MTKRTKFRAGSRRRRVTAELHRRGFTLKGVALEARCTERYVHYVVSGEQPLRRRSEKGQRVLRVLRAILARKPTTLALRDLAKLTRRAARAA